MAHSRQFYQQEYPAVDDSRWMGFEYDHAVVGMAERVDAVVPVYLLALMLQNIHLQSPEAKWSKLMADLLENPHVAILHRPARDSFWERVREGKLLAWELLTPAIMGVMAFGGESPHAVVYNRTQCIDLLTNAVANSDLETDGLAEAQNDYKRQLLSCNAGSKTPWYFYTHTDEI